MNATNATIELLYHSCCLGFLDYIARSNGCFPPSEACMALSDTMKTSIQGGGSQFSSRFLNPVSEVHGVFHLLSATESGSKRLRVLVVSWRALVNNSKKRISCLVLDIFIRCSLALFFIVASLPGFGITVIMASEKRL